MVFLGKVVKAQGIKGEVKLDLVSKDSRAISQIDKVLLDGTSFRVEKARTAGGIFLKLEGIDDRNSAELLVGKKVEIPEESLPPLPDDEHYIVDILGSVVMFEKISENKKTTESGDKLQVEEDKVQILGKLVDVLQHGAADVFVVKTKKNTVMFPSLKRVVTKIDALNKQIFLSEKDFLEVAVYEV